MMRIGWLLAIVIITLALPGCASYLAQGYRSTPDYATYVQADCGTYAMDEAQRQLAKNYVENKFDMDVAGYYPSTQNWQGGLLMALVFAVAQSRSMNLDDACKAAAVAQANAEKR